MQKPYLTGVVLTRNEYATLSVCLRSLQFCDEIIVVDDYSTDETRLIAQKLGASVFKHHLNGNYAFQRNIGLKKARGEWVLFVDADEVVSKALAQNITRAIKKGFYAGYLVKRYDIWLGKKMQAGSGVAWLLRLAKRNSGKWVRSVHEVWEVEGEVGNLSGQLLHYPHPSVNSFIEHVSSYAKLHAEENLTEGKRSSLAKILFVPVLKAFDIYIFKGGYRDGTHGLVYTMIMSLHSFLAWWELYLWKKR